MTLQDAAFITKCETVNKMLYISHLISSRGTYYDFNFITEKGEDQKIEKIFAGHRASERQSQEQNMLPHPPVL